MGESVIRLLKANEIECRVSAINEKGLSLLLYKDARADQRILDETFGIFGWKRSHQSIEGNLYCTVEIYDKESSSWVSKQDVGTAGMAEKEKSQASDSFKRACFNWGIGRELYTAPFIWIGAGKAEIQKRGDRYYCNDRFSVDVIGYNGDREIDCLVVANDRGETVYELKQKQGNAGHKETEQDKPSRRKQKTGGGDTITVSQMEELHKELRRTGVGLKAVQDRYQIGEPEEMSGEMYQKVMAALAKTKSARAA